MKILIESIPHSTQRYETVGDWYYQPDGTLAIKVSEMVDERYIQLVAVHELIEALLCKHRWITPQQIDDWDMNFFGPGEPGDCVNAPYHLEHTFATAAERLLAEALNVDWRKYNDEVNKL